MQTRPVGSGAHVAWAGASLRAELYSEDSVKETLAKGELQRQAEQTAFPQSFLSARRPF
jgi:hypothetical protein